AEAAHLVRDDRAGFFLPGPDALDEISASLARRRTKIVPRLALRGELVLDDLLRRDAGVVGAALPQRARPAHALPAAHRVHARLLERVAHVQRAGDVRRRQQDAIGIAVAVWREDAGLLPTRVPLRFDELGVETLIHDVTGLSPAALPRGPSV